MVKDVLIIGAGPVGLFSVFACGMMGFSCHVIDSLPQAGGQCAALYPEKYLYDMPGFPKVLAKDLVSGLMRQAAQFSPTYSFDEWASHFDFKDDHWVVTTSAKTQYSAHSVVLAAGGGLFRPKRLPLENIEHYEGHSVFYHVHDPQSFRDQDIVIAGGGDSALDWALSLSKIARVTVVHRRAEFRAHPDTIRQFKEAVEAKTLVFKPGYQLKQLHGQDQTLNQVSIATHGGQSEDLSCQSLLLFFGLAHDLGPLMGWGLHIDHKGIVVEPTTCLTSQPQMYAVGDIARYPYKRPLVATGCAEAFQAAQHIYQTRYPERSLHFGHSTSRTDLA